MGLIRLIGNCKNNGRCLICFTRSFYFFTTLLFPHPAIMNIEQGMANIESKEIRHSYAGHQASFPTFDL